jgi:hypothetical protein
VGAKKVVAVVLLDVVNRNATLQWALKALQCFTVLDCLQCGALWNGNHT